MSDFGSPPLAAPPEAPESESEGPEVIRLMPGSSLGRGPNRELQYEVGNYFQLAPSEHRLLAERKLVMMLDLDGTLVDAKMSRFIAPSKIHQVVLVHLSKATPMQMAVSVRPGVNWFLEATGKHFHIHLCTNGLFFYARDMVQFLQGNRNYFRSNIFARRNRNSTLNKDIMIQAAYQHGESVIVKVDDSLVSWNFAANILEVFPYAVLAGGHNPPPTLYPSRDVQSGGSHDAFDADRWNSVLERQHAQLVALSGEGLLEELAAWMDRDPPTAAPPGRSVPRDWPRREGQSLQARRHALPQPYVSVTSFDFDDQGDTREDQCLLETAVCLLKIHTAYFQILDALRKRDLWKTPHTRDIMIALKRQVLRGVVIVFEEHVPWPGHHVARALGADVADSLTSGEATHFVLEPCTQLSERLVKLILSHAPRVKAVWTSWVRRCHQTLQRVDEAPFLLGPALVRALARRRPRPRPRSRPQRTPLQ